MRAKGLKPVLKC